MKNATLLILLIVFCRSAYGQVFNTAHTLLPGKWDLAAQLLLDGREDKGEQA